MFLVIYFMFLFIFVIFGSARSSLPSCSEA